jgi:hypothetical protein
LAGYLPFQMGIHRRFPSIMFDRQPI